MRARDCFNRPIGSVPGAKVKLVERVSDDNNWTFRLTGRQIETLNLSSYNYLGFAETKSEASRDAAKSIRESSIGTCSSHQEIGTTKLDKELESVVANFLGVESSIVFGMGFATNSSNIPCLVGQVSFFVLCSNLF